MKRLFMIAFLAVGLLFNMAACSTSGSNAPSTAISVTLTDFAFSPNTFTVPAGARISFTALNNGVGDHSFLVMKKGYQAQNHFTDADKANVFWGKDPIAAGQTATDSFTAPSDPGEYQIVCGVPGHLEAGMVAKLIVVKP